MIFKSYIVLFFHLLAFNSLAQQDNRETVYLHLNSRTLISGESLYYSAFCRSELTGKTADLSQILYVEIIGSEGPIYQEKIFLKNGRGSGEFFISSLIPTGRYQILAYTRWMTNFKTHFQSSIEIINPFETIIPMEKKSPSVDLDINVGTGLISGIKNTVGLRIRDGNDPTGNYNGKVVSESGEEIAQFTHDPYGLGNFSIVPAPKTEYTIILEDRNSNIKFFKLPKASDAGATINLIRNNNKLRIDINSTLNADTSHSLRIHDGRKTVLDQVVIPNTSLSLELRKLEGKLLTIELIDPSEKVLALRGFFNPAIPSNKISVENSYSKRASVKPLFNLEPGTYSVSVKRKNKYLRSFQSHVINADWNNRLATFPIDATEYISKYDGVNTEAYLLGSKLNNYSKALPVNKLPEFRNEFLDGQLINLEGEPVANKIVALSLIGKPFQLYTATTDSSGFFSLPFEFNFEQQDAFVTPISLDPAHTIATSNPFLLSYPDFEYNLAQLDSSQIMEIVNRSIRVQLQNAYYDADTSQVENSKKLPQASFSVVYNLDDYTRFSTLKETFIEYIPATNVRERRIPIIKPNFPQVPEKEKNQPVLLLDGLPVDAKNILEFGASNLEKISILNNRMFLGPLISDGVILFETFDGNLGTFQVSSYHHPVFIKGITKSRNYKFPEYSTLEKNKNADQRDQLFWDPNYKVSVGIQNTLEFFTSDVTGQFEIVIEGYQEDGQPVSVVKSFLVQ